MKFSKKLVKSIKGYIESGATNKDACVMAGISQSELYLWLSDDPKNPLDEKQKSELSEAMEEARARRNTILANRVIQASADTYLKDKNGNFVLDDKGERIIIAKGDWRAASWYLARTAPEEYVTKTEVEHTDKTDLGTNLANLDDDAAKPLMNRLLRQLENDKKRRKLTGVPEDSTDDIGETA